MKATGLLKKTTIMSRRCSQRLKKMGHRAKGKRSSLAEEISEELRIHAGAEEEIFYPVVKSARDKQAKFEVEEEV